jgi:FkbM family methyltransferase
MLEGIPKKEYPRLFYRYFKEFFEVLVGKTSLKLYLLRNYPSLYKPKVKEGEKLKWKGNNFELPPKLPKIISLPPLILAEYFFPLSGQYSIPECEVKRDDIVFDIGAHFGFFSYYAITKNAREVYAFEPNPYVSEILKKHAEMWSDKIKPFEIALYSSNGFQELLIPNPLAGWSTLAPKEREGEKVKVKTMTLDSFCKEYNVERVDFIKIDAEGSEREILRGAKQTIRGFRPKIAVSAYHRPDDERAIPEIVLSVRED